MRRTERFDYGVARRRAAFGLKLFLQHRLVIGFRCRQRIGGCQLVSQRMTNETRRRLEPAVLKDRAGDRFKHVGQQSVLLPPAALLFSPPETQKIAKVQRLRRLRKRRRTDKAVFHPRQLAFGAAGMRAAQVVGDN